MLATLVLATTLLGLQDPPALAERVDVAMDRGARFLVDRQAPDGSWRLGDSLKYKRGPTALATYALVKAGLPLDHAAIVRGLAFLEHRPPHYTYDASVRILLLCSLDPEAYEDRILRAADVLGDPRGYYDYTLNEGRTAAGDLSNTQFAITAQYALEKNGFPRGVKFWERTLDWLTDVQREDGSFGYRYETEPTITMTLGGYGCLAACVSALETGRAKARLMDLGREGMERAEAWLAEQWTAEAPPWVDGHWRYYAWYSLERGMALSGNRTFAGRDWYEAASDWISRNQAGDGAWVASSFSNPAVNTSLAMLTLARATAVTGAPTGSGWESRWSTLGEDPAALRITAQGAPECLAFLAGVHPNTKRLFAWTGEARPRIERFAWILDGQQLGEEIVVDDAAALATAAAAPRFETRMRLPENRVYRLEARAWVRLPESQPGDPLLEVSSAVLELDVQGLLSARDRREMAFAARQAWAGALLREVEVSSVAVPLPDPPGPEPATHGPHAFDRFDSSVWLCAPDDAMPRIRAEIRKGRPVAAVRLLPAYEAGDPQRYDVPEQILVILNGNRRHTLNGTVDDLADGLVLTLKRPVRVDEIEVVVVKRSRGTGMPGVTGFREIELLAPLD